MVRLSPATPNDAVALSLRLCARHAPDVSIRIVVIKAVEIGMIVMLEVSV